MVTLISSGNRVPVLLDYWLKQIQSSNFSFGSSGCANTITGSAKLTLIYYYIDHSERNIPIA